MLQIKLFDKLFCLTIFLVGFACPMFAPANSCADTDRLQLIEQRLDVLEARVFEQDIKRSKSSNISSVATPAKKPVLDVKDYISTKSPTFSSKVTESDLAPEEDGDFGSYSYAVSLLQMGKVQEAKAQLESILDKSSDEQICALVHYQLGNIEYQLQDYKSASLHFLKSYKIDETSPRSAEILLKSADCLLRIDQLQSACTILQKLEKNFSADPDIRAKTKQQKKKLSGICN